MHAVGELSDVLDPDVYDIAPRRTIAPQPRSGAAGGQRSAQRLRRARILREVREIISEKGCDGISIRDVAEKSAVSPPTIYNLLGSREELIFAAWSENLMHHWSIAEAVHDQTGISPILVLGETFWASAVQDPGYSRNVMNIYHGIKRARDAGGLPVRMIAQLDALICRWLDGQHAKGLLNPRATRALRRDVSTQISRQIRDITTDWAELGTDPVELRRRMTIAIAIPLLAIAGEEEVRRIDDWIGRVG